MMKSTNPERRIDAVRRIFEDYDIGNIQMLDEWDGHDLSAIEGYLSEEEFQTLLDQLQDSSIDGA